MAVTRRSLANDIISRLGKEIKKRGGDERSLRYLLTPQGQILLGQIAGMVVNAIVNSMQVLIEQKVAFKRNMAEEKNWELELNHGVHSGKYELTLEEVLVPGEISIFAKEMRKRAEEKDCLSGQLYAEFLFDKWESIPIEWREYDLLLPGTIWLESWTRRRFIPALRWSGSRWLLIFRWCGGVFDKKCRFVRSVRQSS